VGSRALPRDREVGDVGDGEIGIGDVGDDVGDVGDEVGDVSDDVGEVALGSVRTVSSAPGTKRSPRSFARTWARTSP
jgi:hypothetical protein